MPKKEKWPEEIPETVVAEDFTTTEEDGPTIEPILETKDVVIPTILVSVEAYQEMQCIIQECGEDEISWLGTVKALPDNQFLIGKVVLFNQKVSLGSTEFDQDDLGKFYSKKLKEDPANKEMLGSLLFWGHVHPYDVSPSQQDEDQMKLFAHNKVFIRGIFDRKNRAKFDVYYYNSDIKIINVPWKLYIDDPARRERVAKEIKEKVKQETWVGRYYKYGEC